jgi:hypothetical protein
MGLGNNVDRSLRRDMALGARVTNSIPPKMDPAANSFEMMCTPREEAALQCWSDKLGLKTDMGRAALHQAIKNIQLFDKKQQDYGSNNIGLWGDLGVVVRATDKIMRLRTLLTSKEKPAVAETLCETYGDLANYGIIGQLIQKGIWPLVK